jgi:hypothetical protein
LDRPFFHIQIERFWGRRFFSGKFPPPKGFYLLYAGNRMDSEGFEHGIEEVERQIDILRIAE